MAPTVQVSREQLRRFGEELGLPRCGPSYADQFLAQLFRFSVQRTLNVHGVVDVVRALEGVGRGPTVDARPFRRPPLAGLLHAHFSDARFIPRNLLNAWTSRRDPVGQWIRDNTGREFDERALSEFVHFVTITVYEQRASTGRGLTGEWIVFAEHEGRRFYLTLASHGEEDDTIYSRVQTIANDNFPGLLDRVRAPPAYE
jgi:hypothetical protein